MKTLNPIIPLNSPLQRTLPAPRSRVLMLVLGVVAAHMVLFAGLLIRGSQRENEAAGVALRQLRQAPMRSDSSAAAAASDLVKVASIAESQGAASDASSKPPLTASPQSLPEDSTTSVSAVYVVKPGDTLSRIAKANHTTVKAIRLASGLDTDALAVGQRVRLPVE